MARYDYDHERPRGPARYDRGFDGYWGYYGGRSRYWEPGHRARRYDSFRQEGRYGRDFDASGPGEDRYREEGHWRNPASRSGGSRGRGGSYERGFDIGPAWGGGSDIGYRTYWRGGW